ncbi:MAG: carboxypeptidase-like regulatory domain-containing protein [Candidatus Woykebacteria bacterium]
MKLPLPKFKAHSNSRKGFTLVEILIAAAIVALAGLSIIATITSYLRVLQLARDKIHAQNLANEKVEELRNMPYDSLATVNGPIYPPGTLPDQEQMQVEGSTYFVYTLVSYFDDPFDGKAAGTVPIDLYPYDYKKVTVRIKDFRNSRILAEVSTSVAAKTAETSSDTGILALLVLNSQGQPVADAQVHLTNPNPNPDVDITTYTDVNGIVQIPLLPPDSSSGYHVEVTKTGFSSDGTNPDNIPGYDPDPEDFNIISQQVTNLTLNIDLVSTMIINAVNETGAATASLNLTIRGDKRTYFLEIDPDDPAIAKFQQTVATDSGGKITLNNMEWDSYSIAVPLGYYIVTTSPYQNVSLPAGSTLTVNMVVTQDAAYPAIRSMAPTTGQVGTTVFFTIDGTNLPSGTDVRLKKGGEADVVGTSVISSGGNQLTGEFSLVGVAAGNWNLVVAEPGGKTATQNNGFTVIP